MTIILFLLQAYLILVIVKLFQKRTISPILSASLLFYALMWYVIPVLINTFLTQHLTFPSLVEFDVYVFYAIIEILTLLITLVFLLFSTPYFHVITDSRVGRFEISPKAAVLIILVSLGFYWVYNSFSMLYGSSYYDRNTFLNLAIGTAEFESAGTIFLIQTLLMSFSYACLLSKWPRRKETFLLYVLILLAIASVNIPYLLMGGRIVLLLPLILLILRGQSQGWPKGKMVRVVGGGLVITCFIGGLLAVAVGEYRVRGNPAVQDLIAESIELVNPETSTTSLVHKMLEGIIMKFDNISWGALLVEYVGAGVAGWQPYWGAFGAVIPRQIMPSKPVPGSMDGTYQGIPARLVPAAIGGDPLSYNVQVSPAAIAIWEFGFLGLVIMILCNAVYLRFLNSLLTCPSMITKSLALFLIGIPGFFTLLAPPDVLLVNVQRVVAIYLVFSLVAVVHSSDPIGRKGALPLNDP
jgi:hypothetical protein